MNWYYHIIVVKWVKWPLIVNDFKFKVFTYIILGNFLIIFLIKSIRSYFIENQVKESKKKPELEAIKS